MPPVHDSPLSLKLKEMVEAEDALSEANALNNTNAEVWAYLSLICLHVSAQPTTPMVYCNCS